MRPCRYCCRPLSEAPSRACPSCRTTLHEDCWRQLSAREIAGCGHETSVIDAAFLDADRVLSVDSVGIARLWSLGGGDEVLPNLGEPTRRVHAAPGAGLWALQGDERLRIQGPEGGWAIEAGGYITACALATSGARLIAVAGGQMRGCDPRVKGATLRPVGAPFPEELSRIALSPDGQRAALLLASGVVWLRDAEHGFELGSSPPLQGVGGLLIDGSVDAFGFSADGSRLFVSAFSEVFFLDGLTAQVERRVDLSSPSVAFHDSGDEIVRILMLPSDASGQGVSLEALSDRETRKFGPFSGVIYYLTCGRFLGARRAVVGSSDGSLLVLDLERDAAIAHLRGHHNARWLSPRWESRRLWSRPRAPAPNLAGIDEEGAWVFAGEGDEIVRLARDTGEPGERRSVGEWPSTLAVVNVGGSLVPAALCPGGLRLVREDGSSLIELLRSYDPLSHLVADASGQRLAVCDSWGLLAEVFNEQGGRLWSVETPQMMPMRGGALALQGDGSLGLLLRNPDGSLVLWSTLGPQGEPLAPGPLECPPGVEVGCVTPDGVHAVLSRFPCGDDRRSDLGLFDLGRRAQVAVLSPGHRASTDDVALSPLGTLLACCSRDGSVHVLALPSGRLLASFQAKGPLKAVRFGLDAATLYTWTEDSTLDAWDLSGADRRTTVYGALCRGRDPGSSGGRLLRRLLDNAASDGDPEALAALLLFGQRHPGVPAPAGAWVAGCRGALRDDFDRRVRALVEGLP